MNEEQFRLYEKIRDFPLDEPGARLTFSQPLARENRWFPEYARRVIEEYRKFIFLAMVDGHPVTPSDAVDQVWHLHLTYSRSYWDEFCSKVLGKPLHHQPTQGGAAEKARYEAQYRETVSSYQHWFDEAPPADIWPAPKIRFGRDLHFVRVNTRSHWLLPKPSLAMITTPALLILASLVMVTTLALLILAPLIFVHYAGALGLPNPMNLDGSGFLWFYTFTGFLLLPVAAWLKSRMSLPNAAGRPLDPPLTVEELAYLCGREDRVTDTVLLGLMQRGVVDLDTDRLTLGITTPGAELSPLERSIIEVIGSGTTIEHIRRAVEADTVAIRERLQNLGLLVGSAQSKIARFYSCVIFLPLLVLGILRLVHGLEIGKPVGLLVLWLLISASVIRSFGLQRLHRSRYGDRVLARAQGQTIDQETPPGLLRATALLGASVLSGTAFAELSEALTKTDVNGGDGGCGGGGCGGCGDCGG